MESIQLDPVVGWILRTSLALLFGTAAVHKIQDWGAFMQSISDYEILTPRLAIPGALILVSMECLITIGLFIPGISTPAGLAAIGLLSIYLVAISINLARGRSDIDCGCMGPSAKQPLSIWLVVRNGILILGASATLAPISNRSMNSVDAISFFGGCLMLMLLFSAANILASQSRRPPTTESVS